MKDIENVLSNHQSLVAAAGAILSEKSYDTGVAGTAAGGFQAVGSIIFDIGRGPPLEAFAQVTQEFDSAGDAVTCACALVMADNAALSTNLTVLSETPAIAQAVLLVGYQFRLGTVPVGISRRYVGFRYTTAVADATAGKIFAGLFPYRSTVRVTSTLA